MATERGPSNARVAMAAFAAALLLYLSNASILPINPDSTSNAYIAASLLGDGDLAFSPFEAPFMFTWNGRRPGGDTPVVIMDWNQAPARSTKTWAEHYRDGRIYLTGWRYYVAPTRRERPTREPLFAPTFGPAAGLATLPLAALAQLSGVRLWQDPAAAWGIAKLTAAALCAGSVALLYLIAAAYVSRGRALLVAGAYAAGTCLWAVSSQSLWQQTPEIFFLSLGLWCLLRMQKPWLRGAAAGAALAAAAACRPTAALVAATAAAWLLWSDRRAFTAFVAAALPFAVALLAYNAHYFGSPFEFGQLAGGAGVAKAKTGSSELWQTPLWLGAAGLLVSPSRGLLVYSPFLAAAFAGAVMAWRDARWRELRFLTLAVPALWLPAFLWFDWWGGWAYGYRPIVDTVPMLVLLCLPVLDWILQRPWWRAAFGVGLAWSVFVQGLGAFAYAPWGWNSRIVDAQGTTNDVDKPEYRNRLWSFSDWQIGYLITDFSRARADRLEPMIY